MTGSSFMFATTAIEATLIAIGLVGHLLSIIVFLRKAFRSNSISTYCISLAIVESLTLIQFINDIYNLAYNINLQDLNNTLCKFIDSSSVYLNSIQPWIMVAFSVDKLLGMRVNAIALLKKKWFQWSIVVGIVLFHIVFYIYFPIFIKVRETFPGYFICDLTAIGFFNIYMIVNVVESYLIPSILMTITSALTVRMLEKSRKSIERSGHLSQNRKSRDMKYAFSSLALNIMFVICRLSLAVYFILYAFYSYSNLYFYKIAVLLYYLNMSLSFFVHFITNSVFRREFLILFRVVKKTGESVLSNMNSRTNRPNSSRNQILPLAELY